MSETTTIAYDNASNFTFDTDNLEISGSLAQLKLIANAGQTLTEDFADDTGFTYTSASTEFAAGVARQLDQRPADATFHASYASVVNGNWGDGVLTGTATGSPVITSGQLDLTAASVQYVDYAGLGNADSVQNGAIRFNLKPNYSGTPANTQHFFAISKQAGFSNNEITVWHDNLGNLKFRIRGSGGATIQEVNAGAWSPTSGTNYEFELNWDITAGAHRLFIDGVQKGSTGTNTGTRDSDITLFRVGTDISASVGNNNFLIGSITLFSAPQHTAGYTPGASISETIYVADTVTLPSLAYSGVGTIQSIQSAAITDVGAPRYTVEGKYWDGAAWSVSNGTYAQANSAADVIANIATLSVSGQSSIEIVAYFTGSNTQASCDNIALTYTGQIYPAEETITYNTAIATDDLETLAETSNLTGGTIKYVMVVEGSDKYYNGSAWVASDGTSAQANTLTEVNANAGTLTSVGINLKLKAVLIKGSTTPTLTQNVLTYSFFGGTVNTPDDVNVYDHVRNIVGSQASHIKLIIDLREGYTINNQLIAPGIREFAADSTGYVEANVVKNNVAGPGYFFTIEYMDPAGVKQRVRFTETIITADSRISAVATIDNS